MEAASTAVAKGHQLIGQSVQIRRLLVEESPDDSALLREYCRSLAALGETGEVLGDMKQVAQNHELVMDLSRRLVELEDNDENREILAGAHEKIGDLQRRRGALSLALNHYQL